MTKFFGLIMTVSIAVIDVFIIAILLLLVFGVAAWTTLKQRHNESGTEAEDFFLAERDLPWWAAAGSIFASNIGNEHFIGQAGTAADSGIAVSLFEWTAMFSVLSLGFIFGPLYLKAKVSTIPEWFETRFSVSARLVLAILSLMGGVLTKVSASLFGGAVLCEVVLGINFWSSLPFIIIVTGAYTVAGGLNAVVYTEVLQMVIFTVGGIAASITAVSAVGGWNGMIQIFNDPLKPHLTDFPHAIRGNSSEFAWTGMFFGQMLGSIWYWCIDQEMAQRVLSVRSVRHGKGASIAAASLKLLPPFMIVFPGMAARVMYERCISSDGIEFPLWCETNLNITVETNKAYPYLITKVLPPGIVGLILVSMIVSMMSALASVFNSASTVFTLDIYRRFISPGATEKRLLFVGRAFTAVMIALSFLWLLAIRTQDSGIYLITQNVQTHLSPALATVALLGIFVPRVNGKGAMAGIIVGFTGGLTHYIANLIVKKQCPGSSGVGMWFACLHFNHNAILIGLVTFAVTLGVSLLYPPPERRQLIGCFFVKSAEEYMPIEESFEFTALTRISDEISTSHISHAISTERECYMDFLSGSMKDRWLLALAGVVVIASVSVIFVFR